jgi:hypothetical protein
MATPSASNKICKKVFDYKQWNDCLLASTDVEIFFRSFNIVQNMVSSSKDNVEKVLEMVLEMQIMEMLQALLVEANLDCLSASYGTYNKSYHFPDKNM